MKNTEFQTFLSRFQFREELTGYIGIERERFLVNGSGTIVPRAVDFLQLINSSIWTYELSACQVEDRTEPLNDLGLIKAAMFRNEESGLKVAEELGLGFITLEVAGEDMPLTVYPEPRYMRIKPILTHERLSAACRVTATHIHIGMPNLFVAIQVANYLRQYLNLFCEMGDHSQGERLGLYRVMAESWDSPHYESKEHYYEVARANGFVENSRDCWHLIRISKYGTVELRMFGVTEDLDEICGWISEVIKIISESGIIPQNKLIPV